MARYCCDSIVRGYKDDDDATDFQQQHWQWLELLANNCKINFHELKDHDNHKNLYTTKISTLTIIVFCLHNVIKQ